MKKTFTFLIISVSLFTSCAVKMVTKSPAEVKMMTTRQFETNKDLVFKSVISLLQSESYIINTADKEIGLINAYKRIEYKNSKFKKAFSIYSKDSNTSKAMFYIEEFNNKLTEIKITIYEGSISFGVKNTKNKESMVHKPEIYNQWFNNLRAEIERKKALIN